MKERTQVNEKYLEFQILMQQINQLNQQINLISNQVIELRNLRQSIDEINEVKKSTELLVPLGPGVFIKSSLEKNNELLISIGANIILKKGLEESKELIQKQISELENVLTETEGELINLNSQALTLQKELESSK